MSIEQNTSYDPQNPPTTDQATEWTYLELQKISAILTLLTETLATIAECIDYVDLKPTSEIPDPIDCGYIRYFVDPLPPGISNEGFWGYCDGFWVPLNNVQFPQNLVTEAGDQLVEEDGVTPLITGA